MNKLFRVRREEYGLVAVLGLILFCNAVAQQIAGIVSVSGFLSAGSVNGVLIVWVVDMLLIATVTWLQTLVVDRLNRVRLMRWLLLGCGLAYGVLRLMFALHAAERALYAAMFVFADLQWVIFPLVFWIMANDLSDMAQAKRLFPLIGAASFVGKLVGIGITLSLPGLFRAWVIKPEEALTLNVVIYLLACAVLLIGLRGAGARPVTPKQESLRETLTAGWEFVYGAPSFRYFWTSSPSAFPSTRPRRPGWLKRRSRGPTPTRTSSPTSGWPTWMARRPGCSASSMRPAAIWGWRSLQVAGLPLSAWLIQSGLQHSGRTSALRWTASWSGSAPTTSCRAI